MSRTSVTGIHSWKSKAMLHGNQALQDCFTCHILVTFCNSNYSCLTARDWFDIMYMDNETLAWKDTVQRVSNRHLRE